MKNNYTLVPEVSEVSHFTVGVKYKVENNILIDDDGDHFNLSECSTLEDINNHISDNLVIFKLEPLTLKEKTLNMANEKALIFQDSCSQLGFLHNNLIFFSHFSIKLSTLNDNFTSEDKGYRIDKIYELINTANGLKDIDNIKSLSLIWERPKKKKMTYEEIVNILGYDFELKG